MSIQLYAITDDDRRVAFKCSVTASLNDVLYSVCGSISFLYGCQLRHERVKLAVTHVPMRASLHDYRELTMPDVNSLSLLPIEGNAVDFLEDQQVVYILGCSRTAADEMNQHKTMSKYMASFSSLLSDIFSEGEDHTYFAILKHTT